MHLEGVTRSSSDVVFIASKRMCCLEFPRPCLRMRPHIKRQRFTLSKCLMISFCKPARSTPSQSRAKAGLSSIRTAFLGLPATSRCQNQSYSVSFQNSTTKHEGARAIFAWEISPCQSESKEWRSHGICPRTSFVHETNEVKFAMEGTWMTSWSVAMWWRCPTRISDVPACGSAHG